MKSQEPQKDLMEVMSLPMRGEWIEIALSFLRPPYAWSLPMRGEWIEIAPCGRARCAPTGLSPCGESGLKFFGGEYGHVGIASLPMRGEWIEIVTKDAPDMLLGVSPHAGRVD